LKQKPKRSARAIIVSDITACLPVPKTTITDALSSMHRAAAPPSAQIASLRKCRHSSRVHRGYTCA
jgi:hypothetical protein